MVHPYFVDKARAAFIAAQGNPDHAGPLAEWAEQARARAKPPHGAIVGEDGSILAETVHVRGRVSATYVDAAGSERWGLLGNEVGLAVGAISRRVGQPVIHVKLSQFSGPGSKPAAAKNLAKNVATAANAESATAAGVDATGDGAGDPAENVKVRENRLRRAAERQGLQLQKSRARDPRALDYDRWQISRDDVLVAGELGGPRGLTIDEVERYLTGEGR